MSIKKIKALTFDTGGTILDWHSGFSNALKLVGAKYGYGNDWGKLANEIRRRSLKAMLNLGQDKPPRYNFDDAHRFTIEAIVKEHNLESFTEEDIFFLAYRTPHDFKCWSDFPEILPKLKEKYIVTSFTILSYRLVIDTAKKNQLDWDTIFSCEGINKYKPLPDVYRTVASYLQLAPAQCCMVACHNFDLDAAKGVGFKTAFVRRPLEWGQEPPPDPIPNPGHDIIVDTFPQLFKSLKN